MPSTVDTLASLRISYPSNFFPSILFLSPSATRIVSLYRSVCELLVSEARMRSFPLDVLPCARQDCDGRRRARDDVGRWVRGYKTGLARDWRIVFIGHLRRQGFIEVKKVARHRPPAAMKWAPSIPRVRSAPPSLAFSLPRFVVESFSRMSPRKFFPRSWVEKTIWVLSCDELLLRGLVSYFLLLIRGTRLWVNFELDIDARKNFYVAQVATMNDINGR